MYIEETGTNWLYTMSMPIFMEITLKSKMAVLYLHDTL